MPNAAPEKKDALAREAGHESWEAWEAAVAQERGREVCGAQTRRGYPCPQPRVTRRRRCHMHGGKSPEGPAHPGWKDGSGSKYGPLVSGRLAEHYARLDEAVKDAFDLTAEARLLDARMAEVVEGLREGGQVRWQELRAIRLALRRCVEEIGDEDPAALVQAVEHVLGQVDEFTERAELDEATWREWSGLLGQKRRLVDVRVKQKAQEHGPVHWDDLAFIVERLRAIVAEYVPPARLAEFSDQLRRLGGVLPGHGTNPLN